MFCPMGRGQRKGEGAWQAQRNVQACIMETLPLAPRGQTERQTDSCCSAADAGRITSPNEIRKDIRAFNTHRERERECRSGGGSVRGD